MFTDANNKNNMFLIYHYDSRKHTYINRPIVASTLEDCFCNRIAFIIFEP